jgi:hypothetical protein
MKHILLQESNSNNSREIPKCGEFCPQRTILPEKHEFTEPLQRSTTAVRKTLRHFIKQILALFKFPQPLYVYANLKVGVFVATPTHIHNIHSITYIIYMTYITYITYIA